MNNKPKPTIGLSINEPLVAQFKQSPEKTGWLCPVCHSWLAVVEEVPANQWRGIEKSYRKLVARGFYLARSGDYERAKRRRNWQNRQDRQDQRDLHHAISQSQKHAISQSQKQASIESKAEITGRAFAAGIDPDARPGDYEESKTEWTVEDIEKCSPVLRCSPKCRRVIIPSKRGL